MTTQRTASKEVYRVLSRQIYPPPPPPFNRFPRRLRNKLSFSHKEFSALLVPSELTIGPWVIFRLP